MIWIDRIFLFDDWSSITINELPVEPSMVPFDYYYDFFDGGWRTGQEIHQIVITLRFYQVSPEKTQSRFSNLDQFTAHFLKNVALVAVKS